MSQLGLTRGMATAIVNVVAADPACQAIIPEYTLWNIGQGAAGSLRNFTNMTAEGMSYLVTEGVSRLGMTPGASQVAKDYWEKQGVDQACTNIAAATAKAIKAGISSGALPRGITGADDCSRRPRSDNNVGAHHSATAVTVVTGQTYVFDWHGTLSRRNPLISRRLSAWLRGDDSRRVLYSLFQGWS